MLNRLVLRYRPFVFAAVMSLSTSMIVSAVLIGLHPRPGKLFMDIWPQAFLTAWPVVFVAILVIAPLVNRLLDRLIRRDQ
jgi:hypothetical protein